MPTRLARLRACSAAKVSRNSEYIADEPGGTATCQDDEQSAAVSIEAFTTACDGETFIECESELKQKQVRRAYLFACNWAALVAQLDVTSPEG